MYPLKYKDYDKIQNTLAYISRLLRLTEPEMTEENVLKFSTDDVARMYGVSSDELIVWLEKTAANKQRAMVKVFDLDVMNLCDKVIQVPEYSASKRDHYMYTFLMANLRNLEVEKSRTFEFEKSAYVPDAFKMVLVIARRLKWKKVTVKGWRKPISVIVDTLKPNKLLVKRLG